MFKLTRPRNIFLFILLIINFLLRVDAFRQPYYYDFQDWSRYYLTAHHIVRFGEFVAPLQSGVSIGEIIGSPFYFYFIAAQLLFKDDILFLGWVNLFLQVFNIILVFLLAKHMFGRDTALIASVIFGFSDNILNQSDALWSPYSLQPFLTLSYLLLLFAYLKKSYFSLLFSTAIFLISWGINYSAFGVLPAYSFLAFIILKRIGNSKIYYTGVFITTLLTLLLVYFPRFYSANTPFQISLLTNTILMTIGTTTGMISNPIEILNSLYLRLETLLKFFLVIESPVRFYSFSLSIVVMMIIYFLRMRNKSYQKPYFLILFWAIVQFLFLAAFVKSNYPNDPFPSYYLTPILGIFAILIAEGSNNFLPNRGALKFFKIVFIVLFLYASSPNLSNRLDSIIYKLSHEPTRTFFYIPYQSHPAIDAVKSEVLAIKVQEKINDFNFFQLRGYRVINSHIYDYNHITDVSLFLTHLEIGLGAKLIENIDSIQPNYEQLGSDRYIFLICPSKTQDDNPDECLSFFLKSYSNYNLKNNFFSDKDYRAYLMKKE